MAGLLSTCHSALIDTIIKAIRLYMKLYNTHVSLGRFILLCHLSRLGLYIYQESVHPNSCRLVQRGTCKRRWTVREPIWRKMDSKQQKMGLIVQDLLHLELASLLPLHNFSSSNQGMAKWILSKKGENRAPKWNRSPFRETNAFKNFLHSPIQTLPKRGVDPHSCGNYHYEGLMWNPKKNPISKLNSLSCRRNFVFFSCWT